LYLLIAAIVLILLAVGVLVLLKRKNSRKSQGPVHRTKEEVQRTKERLMYQPAPKPVVVPLPPIRSGDTRISRPPEEIDLIAGRENLDGSMQALSGKYSLESVALATEDGLLFASSGGATALADAAMFSEKFCKGDITGTPGITLFRIDHAGSSLIGIIRSEKPVTEQLTSKIGADTKDILNWWI
jgi:hypothetical protein